MGTAPRWVPAFMVAVLALAGCSDDEGGAGAAPDAANLTDGAGGATDSGADVPSDSQRPSDVRSGDADSGLREDAEARDSGQDPASDEVGEAMDGASGDAPVEGDAGGQDGDAIVDDGGATDAAADSGPGDAMDVFAVDSDDTASDTTVGSDVGTTDPAVDTTEADSGGGLTDTSVDTGSDADDVAEDTEDEEMPPAPASLEVTILDVDGLPLAGAEVILDEEEAEADPDGKAMFEDLDPGDYVVAGVATHHAPAVAVVELSSGVPAELMLVLARVSSRQVVDSSSPVEAAWGRLVVDLPADALEGEFGPASGRVAVQLTSVDPASQPQLIPAPLFGVAEGGEDIFIDGRALAEVRFDEGGDPLNLRDEVTATIDIPIAPDMATDLSEDDEVPGFWLDLETGRWQQEGSGTITDVDGDLVWRATVEHFSWWMPGFPIDGSQSCLNVYVHEAGDTENGLGGATVTIVGPSGIWARNWTNTAGNTCLTVPPERTVEVVVDHGIYPSQVDVPREVTTSAAGPTCVAPIGEPNDCDSIDVAMAGSHCVSGIVTRDGSPVSDAWVRGSWQTAAGPRMRQDHTGAGGGYCLPLVVSSSISFTAGEGEHTSSILVFQTFDTGAEEQACIDGVCTPVDVDLPLIPDTVTCVVGRAFADDTTSFSGELPPVTLMTPITLFASDPDIDCPGTTGDWNATIAGDGMTADGLGNFCVTLTPDDMYSGPDLYPVVGDCETDLFNDACPYGESFSEGATHRLGSCGEGLCYNVGAISYKYGCPF